LSTAAGARTSSPSTKSGAVGSSGEQWGAVGSSGEQWGAVRSSQEQWGAVRSSQEQWGAVRSNGMRTSVAVCALRSTKSDLVRVCDTLNGRGFTSKYNVRWRRARAKKRCNHIGGVGHMRASRPTFISCPFISCSHEIRHLLSRPHPLTPPPDPPLLVNKTTSSCSASRVPPTLAF